MSVGVEACSGVVEVRRICENERQARDKAYAAKAAAHNKRASTVRAREAYMLGSVASQQSYVAMATQ